jgi:Cu-Zn family superoxide dismutase
MRAAVLAAVMALAAGTASAQQSSTGQTQGGGTSGAVERRAAAKIKPFSGNQAAGQARFTELAGGRLRIEVEATGLTPGPHAIHVHTTGDCTNPQASGGHFDPFDTKNHDRPEAPPHQAHVGVLPMIEADQSGKGRLAWETDEMTLAAGKQSIADRAIVIHQGQDDYQSEPAGNSGDRIACGLIQAAR